MERGKHDLLFDVWFKHLGDDTHTGDLVLN